MRTFLRREQYEQLSRLSIDGKILDVGGSTKSGYHELIKGNHTITTGNIKAGDGVDDVFDAQQAWPYENATFDAILFVNVLEHLYDYRNAVREARRVLAPGGIVIGAVPFLYNIHSSPNDYFRYTRFALERLFKEEGYAEIVIKELGTGSFSVILHCLGMLVRWGWLKRIAEPLFTGLDRLLGKLRPGNTMSSSQFPLGYYFEARAANAQP